MEKIDLTIYRGETKDFVFQVIGDKTTDKLYFTCKANRDLTGSRLVDKSNSVAESTGITAETELVESVTNTAITVSFGKTDTQDLTQEILEYDLIAVDPSDDSIITPLISGVILIEQNVRTDYDGSKLPSDPSSSRLLTLNASDFTDGDMFTIDTIDGVKQFVSTSLAELRKSLNGYSEYSAFISQSESDPPEIDQLITNELDAAIEFARTDAGTFTITADSGVFTAGKTVVFFGRLAKQTDDIRYTISSDTVINFLTYRSGVLEDVLADGVFIKIMVFE